MARYSGYIENPRWQCSYCGRLHINKGLAVACENKHKAKRESKADARTKKLIALGYVESKLK